MLPEILVQNLNVVFAGMAVHEISDDLGFYHLGPRDKFWDLLEYSGISPAPVVSETDRKALVNAKHSGVLNDMYRQFFFEKKEGACLKLKIGMADLNRRLVVTKDDEPSAQPTPDDLRKFVGKIEKFNPKIVAFVMNIETFERCLKQLYPAATRERGRQGFQIGQSEVWLLGSASGGAKDREAAEQVFDDLAERLKAIGQQPVA
jgi:G:T/U-mismatch repair DNA glycosylase